jgi:hypothetical protein
MSAWCSIAGAQPCRIEIIDKSNGWPVPLVELKTTHEARLVSDNAGIIALDLPELFGRETWFFVSGHGYEVVKDGFGYRGVRITPEPGKTLRVEVSRILPAKRIGRLTGAGIFAESQKCGLRQEWKDSAVLGCDSLQLAQHNGKLHWIWGDTTLAHYPLGVFHASSATTPLQPLTSFQPPLALKFDYFLDERSRPRGVAQLPGDGPTWLSACASLPAADGTFRLVATYAKIRGFLEAYEMGLCVWDDKSASFQKLRAVWTKSADSPKAPPIPDGHSALWKDADGKQWVLFGNPLPALRCSATFESWQDSRQWEELKPQKSLPSADGGGAVTPHTGSIAWNASRKRWVTVFMQNLGKPSAFGELWYAESAEPAGPWGKAVKILTHDNYTFYNPRLHPELTPPDSPILLFEGTYTQQFAQHPIPTARYDYNQILYRLDLDDSALAAAQSP